MTAPLNVAVVGCGYWGPNLIRNFDMLPDTFVSYVCDVDADRLGRLKERFQGVKTTRRFDDLVGDPAVDAIAVVTPVAHHHELAMASLDAGKHAFVEKPLAASLEQGKEMVRLAGERNLTLMTGHTFVYSAPVRKIKEIVESGDIGSVIYVSAQRLNLGLFQSDINVVWDLAPHDISILLYLLGEMPAGANCQGKAHFIDGIEDAANLSLDFPGGAFAIIHTSWLNPHKTRLLNIIGTKRMISYDDTEPLEKIKVYDKCVEPIPHYDSFGEFHHAYHYGDMYAPYFKQTEPLAVECQHFADCIRTGTEPDSSGRDGLRVLQVLEAANESLRNQGVRVPIEPLA